MYGIKSASPAISKLLTSVSLNGKSVIVIGGTSGIGNGLAKAAKRAGASVIVVGRNLRDKEFSDSFVKADLSTMREATRIANELPFESADVIIFTNGIVPGNNKVSTNEGIELDMAASALNRHVILSIAAPRLKASTRVLIWGFPGSKGYMAKTNIHDFNSDQSFTGGFGTAHMNTVALNEALVCHWAEKGIHAFGFNPGLIKTDIRKPLTGGGIFGGCLEFFVSLANPSVEDYAQRILPLFVAPELNSINGVMFGQHGGPIHRSSEFEDPATVKAWIDAAEALSRKALAA